MTFCVMPYQAFGTTTTPPTSDPYASYVRSLLHFNASGTTIADVYSENTWTAFNSATQSTTAPMWGTGSLSVPNNTSAIVTSNAPSNFNFGTGDFTVELAIDFDSTQTVDYPVPIEAASSTAAVVWQFYFDNFSGAEPYMFWWNPSTNIGGKYHATNKAWAIAGPHYLAYSRVAGVGYLYFDGVRIGTGSDTTNYAGVFGVVIGQQADGSNGTVGKYDEVRITHYGRYTGTSYTLQTEQFPDDGVSSPLSSGWRSPAAMTSANYGNAGATWTNPNNILVADGSYSTSTSSSGATNYLGPYNFGFSVPVGATVTKLEMKIKAYATVASGPFAGIGHAMTTNVNDLFNSAYSGFVDTPLTTSDTTTIVTDPSWIIVGGSTITPAQINNVNFGVLGGFTISGTPTPQTCYVDHIQLRVTWTV